MTMEVYPNLEELQKEWMERKAREQKIKSRLMGLVVTLIILSAGLSAVLYLINR